MRAERRRFIPMSHFGNKGVDFLQQPTQHPQLVHALQASGAKGVRRLAHGHEALMHESDGHESDGHETGEIVAD